jgi:hypothetical protein
VICCAAVAPLAPSLPAPMVAQRTGRTDIRIQSVSWASAFKSVRDRPIDGSVYASPRMLRRFISALVISKSGSATMTFVGSINIAGSKIIRRPVLKRLSTSFARS